MTPATDTLEQLRSDAAALVAEHESVERAPLARVEALAQIKAFVADQARASGFDASAFARRRGVPRTLPAPVVPAGVEPTPSANVAPALVLLMPGQVTKRLAELMDEQTGGAYGLPADERAAELERIDAELYRIEADEEREVCRLEAAGMAVRRRSDIRHALVVALIDDPKIGEAHRG